jgi:hypothetical protein
LNISLLDEKMQNSQATGETIKILSLATKHWTQHERGMLSRLTAEEGYKLVMLLLRFMKITSFE